MVRTATAWKAAQSIGEAWQRPALARNGTALICSGIAKVAKQACALAEMCAATAWHGVAGEAWAKHSTQSQWLCESENSDATDTQSESKHRKCSGWQWLCESEKRLHSDGKARVAKPWIATELQNAAMVRHAKAQERRRSTPSPFLLLMISTGLGIRNSPPARHSINARHAFGAGFGPMWTFRSVKTRLRASLRRC